MQIAQNNLLRKFTYKCITFMNKYYAMGLFRRFLI